MDSEQLAITGRKLICKQCHSEFPVGTDACPNDGGGLIAAQDDPLIGTVFADRYDIVSRVGKGGMGVVYKARQTFMDTFVAIKVLYKEHTSNQITIERFVQEAKTLATLKHPNILHIVDFGITPNNEPFLIMEFLEGEALDDYLDHNGTMTATRALPIFMQACDGLSYAHSKGVIHRDLKPGNLLLTKNEFDAEVTKIVDFGIAKMKPQTGKEEQHLTQAGEIFGSPLYMSPEQCQGKTLDERSDLYSLACVIYESFTGTPPLMGANAFATMTMHVNEKPLPMRGAAPDLAIPEPFDAVVMKALNKEPNKRQKSIAIFKKELIEAAQASNIFLNSGAISYQPQPFTTGEYDAISGQQRPVQAVTGVPSAEVETMVAEAVAAARQEEIKKRKQAVSFAGFLIAFVLTGVAALLVMPGPKEDPAPPWRKLLWRSEIWYGDSAEQSKNIDAAIAAYKQAEATGGSMGPIYDLKLKAQLKLLGIYKAHDPSRLPQLQKELLEDHLQRMVALYGADSPDVPALTQLDSGLLSASLLNPKSLNPEIVNRFTSMLLMQARTCIDNKKYRSAESWLLQAIQFEERAGNKGMPRLCDTTNNLLEKCKNAPEEQSHLKEIEDLLKRAHTAEQGEIQATPSS